MLARYTWPLYTLLLTALAWIFFADLLTLGLDTHDAETFRDHERIAENPAYFFSPDKQQASGRPVAELLKFLYFLAAGNDPTAFHLLAIALHVLCSFLVAQVAFRLGASLELSLAGGLLFLTNIAHFQVVHYISAMDYALALSLGLGALLAYQSYLQSQTPSSIGAFYILLLAAVFSHLSMVIALPFSLYLSWHRGENLRTIIRRLAPLALLLALAFLTQLALASRETSTWNSLEHYPDADFLALVLGWLRVLLWLLSRLLTTAHWLPLPVALQTWELYLGALVLIGLAYGAWRKDIWAVWTLLALMPFLFLTEATLIDMPVGPSRYLYPASAGASLLLARGLYQIGQRPPQIGLLAALLFSSYATLDKTEALSRYTSGRSYIASSQTAHGMQRHGDMPKGIDQLRRAIDLGGDAIDLQDAHTRLILIALDSAQVATPILRAARTHFPDDAKFALAEQVFHSLHADPIQQRHALTALETAGDQSADNAHWIATLYANMGDGYYARRDWPLAIRAYEHALRFDPGRKNTRLLVGWTYFITNRFEDAIAAYRAVLARGPDSEAQFNMGLAYMALGDLEIAQKTYAEGFARYGRREADQAKVRENLERLTAQGIQPEATRQLLQRYFPD